ncbi:hypothetical protein DBV15_01122 [Temnothorax longispinosus]|uniref:Uncharacterized protein n=1 Tax=Temnothorax longispinosus TaxID=300112 RepID=A0A4S2J9Y1_9HYME|nr:hypothetical protein DBV15_01122 [Temnothorax longispinosus]
MKRRNPIRLVNGIRNVRTFRDDEIAVYRSAAALRIRCHDDYSQRLEFPEFGRSCQYEFIMIDNEDEGAKVHHNQRGIRLSAVLDVDREKDCSFCLYPRGFRGLRAHASNTNHPSRKDISWIKRLTLKQCNKATAPFAESNGGAWSAEPHGRGGRTCGAAPRHADPRSGRQGRGETLKRVEVLPVSLREIDRGPQES